MLLKPLPDGRGSSRARMKGGACQNYGGEGRRPRAIRRAATLRSVPREAEAPDAGLARGGCDQDRVATARRRAWRPGPTFSDSPLEGDGFETRSPATVSSAVAIRSAAAKVGVVGTGFSRCCSAQQAIPGNRRPIGFWAVAVALLLEFFRLLAQPFIVPRLGKGFLYRSRNSAVESAWSS